jgi:3-keto-disaccharide hydrolase
MSALFQDLPPQVCPQCKVVLPHVLKQVQCYNCGYQFTNLQKDDTSERTQFHPVTRIGKDRSRAQKRVTFVYLISVILVFFLLAAGIHAVISLPIQTSGVASTSTPAYPIPKRPPLFADSFVNDAFGWNLQSVPGNYAAAVGNGTLTLEDDNHTLLWELLPGERTYGDFTLTVNVILSEGDQNNGYGVYIRGASNHDTDLAEYYRFELYGDASYAIFKGTLDRNGKSTSTKIVNYTLNSAIQKQGRINHIMIIAKGPTMSLIVNDKMIKTFSDPSYTSGSIALFVSNLPEAKADAQVKFFQLAVYPVQAHT